MSDEFSSMGDAAFPHNLDGTSFDAVGGYLQSPNAFHGWMPTDWKLFRGFKLPIWVANFGAKNGINDGSEIVRQLHELGVPKGKLVALDLEESQDTTYVEHCYQVVSGAGYKMWVYGSASTVFANPPCNGYWVADFVQPPAPFMYNHPKARATQWKRGNNYDTSTVLGWTLREFWR